MMFDAVAAFASTDALVAHVHAFKDILAFHDTHFAHAHTEWTPGALTVQQRQRTQAIARRLNETKQQWNTCCKTILAEEAVAQFVKSLSHFQGRPGFSNAFGLLQQFRQRVPDCLAVFGPSAKPSLFHFSLAARTSSGATPDTLSAEFATFWKLREEALARQRLQALKDNDADAYMEHLSSLKITSLLRIMEQTHAFMTRVGATLQRKSSASDVLESAAGAAGGGGGGSTSASDDEYRRFKEYVASAKDEFKLVHKVEVFVEVQPRGLNATLMPHQMVGLRFLVSLFCNGINGILADEMGVGKTIQTLALLLHLKEHMHVKGPHLILAPLSIVREWKDACASFVGGFLKTAEFVDLASPAEALQYDLVLLAVHRVRAFVPQLKAVRWNFVVVDEAHKAIANLHTITAQAVLQIPFCRRLVLTGTPLNSDLQELWSLLHFLNPDVFTEQASFDDVFRRPFAHVSDTHDVELSEEERGLLVMRMHQVLRPFMLRRTKKDIDSTLRITFHHVRCPLTVVQERLLHDLRAERRLPNVSDGQLHWRSTLTIESSAQLICNHPFLIPYFTQLLQKAGQSEHDATHIALRCSGKFLVLDSILQRAAALKRKLVIFTHWLDCVDLLTEYFEFRGWADAYVVLTGATSADERRANVDRFRADPNCWIFLVTVKAGGCGINLQVAHLVIVLDKDYTGTNEDQAIARVLRIGQRNTVRALFLLTDDPSESRVAHIADRKDKPRRAIIEGGAYNTNAATAPPPLPLAEDTGVGEEEDEDARCRRLMAESDAYGTADSVIDCTSLLYAHAQQLQGTSDNPVANNATDSSSSTVSSSTIVEGAAFPAPTDAALPPLHGLFDALIATETGGGLEQLQHAPFEHVQGAFADAQCDATILRGWQQLDQPEAECGRGKRVRDEVNLLMPTEAFWDKHAELDMDDVAIIALYRQMVAAREGKKAARLEELNKARGFADTQLPGAAAKLTWVVLRRRGNRQLVALPEKGNEQEDEDSDQRMNPEEQYQR